MHLRALEQEMQAVEAAYLLAVELMRGCWYGCSVREIDQCSLYFNDQLPYCRVAKYNYLEALCSYISYLNLR